MNRDEVKVGEWYVVPWEAESCGGPDTAVKEKAESGPDYTQLMCWGTDDAIQIAREHNTVLRLPRTADGVAVVPGMVCWQVFTGEKHATAKTCQGLQVRGDGVPIGVFYGPAQPVAENRYYSTKAAAEAARSKGNER